MASIADLGARALRRLGVAAVADADQPSLTATTTQADIATRALQGLGIIVPASARPAVGPAAAAAIATRALQNLGIVVPAGDRPVNTATITVTELATRALRAMDIPVPAAERPGTPTIVTVAAIATNALMRLGVMASDESPITRARWWRFMRRWCSAGWSAGPIAPFRGTSRRTTRS